MGDTSCRVVGVRGKGTSREKEGSQGLSGKTQGRRRKNLSDPDPLEEKYKVAVGNRANSTNISGKIDRFKVLVLTLQGPIYLFIAL